MSIELLHSTLRGMRNDNSLHVFAADCAERVYPVISSLDGEGVLQEALDAARSGDPDRLAQAGQAARRFARGVRRSDAPNKQQLLRAIRAVKACTLPDGQKAAIATCNRVVNAVDDKDDEIKWQLQRLGASS